MINMTFSVEEYFSLFHTLNATLLTRLLVHQWWYVPGRASNIPNDDHHLWMKRIDIRPNLLMAYVW